MQDSERLSGRRTTKLKNYGLVTTESVMATPLIEGNNKTHFFKHIPRVTELVTELLKWRLNSALLFFCCGQIAKGGGFVRGNKK